MREIEVWPLRRQAQVHLERILGRRRRQRGPLLRSLLLLLLPPELLLLLRPRVAVSAAGGRGQ